MPDSFRDDIAALIPRLRRFAHALCGDREDGDDLVQTACIKALSKSEQFTPGTRLDSWMFRIVQTTFLDDRRRAARRGPVHDPDTEVLSDAGLGAASAEDRLTLARVRTEIAALPPDQRAVIALVALEGCSYKEAAHILEIPVGTVMSRLSRARARLAHLVGEVPS